MRSPIAQQSARSRGGLRPNVVFQTRGQLSRFDRRHIPGMCVLRRGRVEGPDLRKRSAARRKGRFRKIASSTSSGLLRADAPLRAPQTRMEPHRRAIRRQRQVRLPLWCNVGRVPGRARRTPGCTAPLRGARQSRYVLGKKNTAPARAPSWKRTRITPTRTCGLNICAPRPQDRGAWP